MRYKVWAPSWGMSYEASSTVEALSAGQAAVKWVEKNDPGNDYLVAEGGSILICTSESGQRPIEWQVSGEPKIYYSARCTGAEHHQDVRSAHDDA